MSLAFPPVLRHGVTQEKLVENLAHLERLFKMQAVTRVFKHHYVCVREGREEVFVEGRIVEDLALEGLGPVDH